MPQIVPNDQLVVTTRPQIQVAFARWYQLLRENPDVLICEHGADFDQQATNQLLHFLRTQNGLLHDPDKTTTR